MLSCMDRLAGIPELLCCVVDLCDVVAFDAVGDGEVGAGVAGGGGGEFGGECGEGSAASGGAGGVEAHVQGGAGDLQVPGQGERFAEQGAAFVAARSAVAAVSARLGAASTVAVPPLPGRWARAAASSIAAARPACAAPTCARAALTWSWAWALAGLGTSRSGSSPWSA